MSPSMRSAALCGIIAGTVMLAVLIVGANLTGLGWDSPLRWILAILGSEPALIMAGEARGGIGTTTVIILGLAIHFITAIAWARLFMTFSTRLNKRYLPAVGLAYGGAIWLIMRFGLLGVFDEVMYTRVRLIPGTFLTAHLLYGATLGGAYSVLRNQKHAEPEPR